jgi:catechol 2,3-dioxygenase-like lactoylglutathione lyase family enzyme
MATALDHIIVAVNDLDASVTFYTEILGLSSDGEMEPFAVVRVTPDLTLQLAPWGTDGGMHLAFAMSPDEFENVFVRLRSAGIEYGDAFHAVQAPRSTSSTRASTSSRSATTETARKGREV